MIKNFKFFLKEGGDEKETDPKFNIFGKSNRKETHIAMFSDFFENLSDNMFYTNSMFASFKDEILESTGIYSPREKIVIDIFESTPSDEGNRDFALIAFRQYIQSLYHIKWLDFMNQVLRVSILALFGVLLGFVVYGFGFTITKLQEYLTNVVSSVLLWQFVGYWAFEYSGVRSELMRLKQIENAKFTFTAWE